MKVCSGETVKIWLENLLSVLKKISMSEKEHGWGTRAITWEIMEHWSGKHVYVVVQHYQP